MAQRKTKFINIRALRLENYKSPPTEKGKQAANPVIPQSTPKLPRHHPGEHFLKGPVPFSWLAKAGRCGGRALHVGIILWYRAGLERSPTIRIPSWVALAFGLNRNAKSRGLQALEEVGLVSVARATGRSPVITLLDAQASSDH